MYVEEYGLPASGHPLISGCITPTYGGTKEKLRRLLSAPVHSHGGQGGADFSHNLNEIWTDALQGAEFSGEYRHRGGRRSRNTGCGVLKPVSRGLFFQIAMFGASLVQQET